MLPHIYIGNLHLPSYSLMVALGAVAFAIYYIFNIEKRENLDKISSNRLLFVAILGFLVLGVSALFFNSLFHSIELGRLYIGGITWLGGVIGVIPAMYFLIHFVVPKERGNEINRFSTMFPGLVIAHALGRIGCFLAGCCYGAPTSLPIGVVYPAGSNAAIKYPDTSAECVIKEALDSAGNPIFDDGGNQVFNYLYPSLPLLPTQLIEAIFEIILFVIMLALYKKIRNYNVELYCFAYGAFRFILEFWRADERGATGMIISPSQLMSIILWICAVLLILFRNRIIFKSLYEKCERWRLEAIDIPANAPIFKTRAKANADSVRALFALRESGEIDEADFLSKKEALLETMVCLAGGSIDICADALREIRVLLGDCIITEAEYESLRARLTDSMCKALAIDSKKA